MSVWTALLVGLIAGWLIEWVIDWLFWRRQEAPIKEESTRMTTVWQNELNEAKSTIRNLEQKLQEALNREPEVVVKEVTVIKETDHLEDINGIGEVFAQRLNESGVYSFADLADLTPRRIHEIIDPQEWQAIDAAAWIAEARAFVAAQRMN